MDWTKSNETEKKWFRSFLKEQRFVFEVYFIQAMVFALIFLLAELPFSFYWYSLLLSAFLISGMLVFKAFRYRKKWETVSRIREWPLDKLEQLAASETATEQFYEERIIRLASEIRLLKRETKNRLSDQLDYFTLWLHQIKTPIASLSLLFQQARTAEPMIKEMEKELIRIEDYTQMALGYMKLEQPGEELDIQKEALDPIIKQVLKKYALLFVSKKITLEYEPSDLNIVTDRQWLELLIELLVSNSLKYTPEKGTIRIGLAQKDRLVIEDTGIGIRKEDLPKIFERGYLGWNARRSEKSTGLGLFLSRKICRRLGYRLFVRSEVEKGTSIEIDLNQRAFSVYD